MADRRVELAAKAEREWTNYASTCRMGGTREQRSGAFERAMKAERKIADLEFRLFTRAQSERRAAA
jgi:hypothetical protein